MSAHGRCESVYPPSADAPHDGPGWSAPLRCVLRADHEGDRHWNSGINWRTPFQKAGSDTTDGVDSHE